LNLAKVTFMLKQSVKLRRHVLYGGVATCYVQEWCVYWVLCRASLGFKRKLTDDGHGLKHVGAILI
jgi:hypothetical protein